MWFLVILSCSLPFLSLADFWDLSDETRADTQGEPLICYTSGCVSGKQEAGNLRSYHAFYGVPYATPPTGDLRFRKPIPAAVHKETWDASFPRSECVQKNFRTNTISGSEDCLYLNVYRPASPRQWTKLPVLVFFHGGAFRMGGADPSFYGPEYLMNAEEIIVVTVQYRLGVFGFLASGDADCRGNFGLKDQLLALKWIKANIESFGGNPNSVTLYGESSGAASAHYLMMSPKANGLFHKVIMSGGTALSHIYLERNPNRKFHEFATAAGVPRSKFMPTSDIVDKLRQIPANELQKSIDSMYEFQPLNPLFKPVIEGPWGSAIVTQDPLETWKSGEFEQRPIWYVQTTNEGGLSTNLVYDEIQRKFILDNFDNFLLDVNDVSRRELPAIMDHYFHNSTDNLQNIIPMMTDRHFVQPLYNMVKQHLEIPIETKAPLDIMIFGFHSEHSASTLLHDYSKPEEGPYKHDLEMYIFGNSILEQRFIQGSAEEDTRNFLVKFIVRFAKQGMHRSTNYQGCTVELFKKDGFCQYMYLQRKENKPKIIVSSNFDTPTIHFWDRITM